MAKKARYTVRLYRLHDLDLITFSATHEFNIMRAIYSSLSAFAKDEVFVIDIPPRRDNKLQEFKRVYIKSLVLDTEKDKEAIRLLSMIAPGYRNSFLKHLLRIYLCNPLSEEFFRVVQREKLRDDEKKDENGHIRKGRILFETPQQEIDEKTAIFTEKFKIFREGRKTVQAGAWVKTKKEEEDYKVEDEEFIGVPVKSAELDENNASDPDEDFMKPPKEADEIAEQIKNGSTLTGGGDDSEIDGDEVMQMFDTLNQDE